MLLTLAVIATTFCVSFAIILKVYRYFCYCDAWKIPGPPGWPIIGNVLDFGFSIDDSFESFQRLAEEYGTYFRIWEGPFNLKVVLSEPNAIEKLLTPIRLVHKSNFYDAIRPWLGSGLVNSEASVWRRHRKLLEPTFHTQNLENFTEVFNSASNLLADILQQETGPVDLCPYLQLFSLDVICETVMGVKINSQMHENVEYVEAIEGYLEQFIKKFFSVLATWGWYYRRTNDYKAEQRALGILKKFSRQVIRNRINEKATEARGLQSKRLALLDLMLELKDEGTLTEEEVNDEVNTFLLAGDHTVARAMGFTLFQLAKSPEVQRKLVEEIRSTIGAKNVEMKQLQELEYLDRVIKEVLRMYPPAVFVERKLPQDHQIGKYMLPKNTAVTIFIRALHLNPDYFPDPYRFDPDRWLPENGNKIQGYAFIPFSAGPRNCIGKRFAMLDMKITLVNVLRRLEFSAVVPEHVPRLGSDGVLKSMNGLRVNVKVRS